MNKETKEFYKGIVANDKYYYVHGLRKTRPFLDENNFHCDIGKNKNNARERETRRAQAKKKPRKNKPQHK